MAGELVRYELLCFLQQKSKILCFDDLVTLSTDFYCATLWVARYLLLSGVMDTWTPGHQDGVLDTGTVSRCPGFSWLQRLVSDAWWWRDQAEWPCSAAWRDTKTPDTWSVTLAAKVTDTVCHLGAWYPHVWRYRQTSFLAQLLHHSSFWHPAPVPNSKGNPFSGGA